MDDAYKLLLLSDVHKAVNHWEIIPELDNPGYVSCFLGDLASGPAEVVRGNIKNIKKRIDYLIEGNHDRAVHDTEHREDEFCSHVGELRNLGHIKIALKLKKYCEEAQNLAEELKPDEISFFENIPRILELKNNGETVVCVHDTYAPKEVIKGCMSASSDPTRILDKERAEINFDWMEYVGDAKYLATGHTHMPFIASRKMSSKGDGLADFKRILEFDSWKYHMKGTEKIKVDNRTVKYVIPLDENSRYIIGDGSISSIKNYQPDNGTFIKDTYKSFISYAILNLEENQAEFIVKKVA